MLKRLNLTYAKVGLIALLLTIIVGESWHLLILSRTKTQSPPSTATTLNLQSPPTAQDLNDFWKVWSKKMDTLGPQVAYGQFVSSYSSTPANYVHELAHIIGQLIYSKMGVDGIAICDKSFAFGCYHTFLASAIKDHGLEIIPSLNQKCANKLQDQALGCTHGLGHGLVADLGYSDSTLNQALGICAGLSGSDPIGGCAGGVFMEYNLRTLEGPEGQLRTFNSAHPYHPCLNLPSQYRPACIYWQTQWWGGVISGSAEEVYNQIGKYCFGLTNNSLQQECFRGAGNAVTQFANWEVDKTIQLCNLMPTKIGKLECRGSAAGLFWTDPLAKAHAKEICHDADSNIEQSCLKFSKLDTQ